MEYHEPASVGRVLASAKQFPNVKRIPAESRLLYFHTGHGRLTRHTEASGGATVDRKLANVLPQQQQQLAALHQRLTRVELPREIDVDGGQTFLPPPSSVV